MENKLISIIIPLYNKEKAIARAIESIICQTYTDWECVIINDGSTDGSVDVVRTFLSNEKIRLIHQENGGVSKARNKGLDEAKGEHGVVFSIIFHVPFVYVPLANSFSSGNNRVFDLLEALNLSDRVLSNDIDYYELYKTDIKWNQVDKLLEEFRGVSVEYLNKICTE